MLGIAHKVLPAWARMIAACGVLLLPGVAAAEMAQETIPHQKWSFAGPLGHFDKAQLQRGFKVYKEVCANCHSLRLLHYRNLSEEGGPGFTEGQVKSLIKDVEFEDALDDNGNPAKRPAVPADAFKSPFPNEKAAQAANNGALPPDLSNIPRARAAEVDRPFYLVPAAMLMDVGRGYQESGADYTFALLNGYVNPPANMKMSESMHYNAAFPGNQIAMIKPLLDGQVKYADGTQATVEQYARDVTAFLMWTGDPKLEERKSMGWKVMLYLLITTLLLYFAKKRLWSSLH